MTEDNFNKFPSIESFANVWHFMGRKFNPEPVTYGAKIKLHGTNGGIRVTADGTVTAQSRSRDLTVEEDNAGFCNWVTAHAGAWRDTANQYPGNETITFFGEWAGKGIQKNDAVTKLDQKYFFLFSVQVGDVMYSDITLYPELDNVLVLPWYTDPFTIDFTKADEANVHVDRINADVEKIGMQDPFIYETFGIEGVGEGLVLMPYDAMERDTFSAMVFKAKSEAHRVNAKVKAVSSRTEVPEGVAGFIDMFVTEARGEQGLTEACEGYADKAKTSDFLKWMGNDIRKESTLELEEMGMDWKAVAPHVNKAAVFWFMNRCQSLAA